MKEMTKENLKAALGWREPGTHQVSGLFSQGRKGRQAQYRPAVPRHCLRRTGSCHQSLEGTGWHRRYGCQPGGGHRRRDFEVDEMYAAYLAVAELQGEKGAKRSMTYAIEAEKIHADMYGDAKASSRGRRGHRHRRGLYLPGVWLYPYRRAAGPLPGVQRQERKVQNILAERVQT